MLATADLPIMQNDTHIVPVLVGDPERYKRASDLLLKRRAIYIQPINYPPSPKALSGCALRHRPTMTMP